MKIASFLCRVVLSSVTCLTIPYFSRERHNLKKKVTDYKMCVLILSTIFVRHVSHLKKNWARYWHRFM